MKKIEFLEKLELSPVIAAIKGRGALEDIKNTETEIVFLLTTNIFEVKTIVEELKKDKVVFVHFDLIDGISKNQTGLQYIAQYVKPHGIISTKSNIIISAKKMGLLTVQRHFILDSISLNNTIEVIKDNKPDAVEVMPGLISKVVKKITTAVEVPVIAGGLIEEKQEVISCIKSGVTAVSTTKKELWDL